MRRAGILLLALWSATAFAAARDSGIARATPVSDSVSTASPLVAANAPTAMRPALAQVRLAMPSGGGWWRLDAASSRPDRLLLV
jgi:hypothetical protein